MYFMEVKESLLKKIEGIQDENILWLIWDFVKGICK